MAQSAVVDLKDQSGDQEEVESTSPVYEGLNIYQRIALIMQGIGRLSKDGTHLIFKDGKKVGQFDYISHDAVTSHIRDSFIACGVAVVPTVLSSAKDGNRTELVVQVDFVCIDNPSDRISVQSVGYGNDGSDKGPGKAYSYAVKYAYMKILMLNSGDDTQSEEHDPEAKRISQQEEEQNVSVEALKRWANNFNLAIDGADDPKIIDALQKENAQMLMRAPDVTRDYFIKKIQDRKQALADAERGEIGDE